MTTLLKQGTQVRSSKIYEDIDLGNQNINRETRAHDVTTLEEDLNIIRSILKDIHGEAKWTDAPKITLQELEAFVQIHNNPHNHEKLFHHDRNEVTKLTFNNGTLTDIKTYNDDQETILLAHTRFTFLQDTLNVIDKITYTIDGTGIHQHLRKTFIYDANNNLEKINNEKIV